MAEQKLGGFRLVVTFEERRQVDAPVNHDAVLAHLKDLGRHAQLAGWVAAQKLDPSVLLYALDPGRRTVGTDDACQLQAQLVIRRSRATASR